MKKTFFCALLFLSCFLMASPAYGADLALECKSAILMDGVGGEILYEQNSREKCYPASVTKLMTLTLILEAIDAGNISLEDMVSVSEAAASMGGSQVFLYAGEQRSVNDMLIAIAVGSGNDAAYAMAEFLGGTAAGFADMMNQRALELGMKDTHFVNPHGLHDDDHYTTAYDMALLACHAIQVPKMLDYTSIYEYEFRPEPNLLTLWNTNRLLKWYEGTDGLKTGFTEEAGRNLVSSVKRDGMRLISVVLGAEEKQGHFNQSMTLLNYGFNTYQYETLYHAGEVIAQTPISKGKTDSAALTAKHDIGYIAAKGQEPEITENIEIFPDLQAPMNAGDTAGKITVNKDGKELISADLILMDSVEKGGIFRTVGKLLDLIW